MPVTWVRPLLYVLAANQAFQGLSLALAPGSFYDSFANFGPRNDHFLRDLSTFPLASAVVLIAAARRPSWRVPALAMVTLQYVLHTINHVIDVGDAEPAWVGPFDVATLAIVGVLAAALWQASARVEQERE